MTKHKIDNKTPHIAKHLLGDVICWWSGGVTSAVACKIAIDIYGIERCKLIMIDTQNEDDDTYRFKADCEKWYGKEIEIPKMYQLGFQNNNCFKTGCVQGGIGYWQKMKREFPDKFYAMAEIEHELTDESGEPKTMLKDQSKEAKESFNELVFLVKHPDYPNLKSIDEMPDCKVEPLFDCNGLCGINDFDRNKTEKEINYQGSLFYNIP